MTNLDLNDGSARLDLSLKTRETDGERRLRLIKDGTTFGLAILIVLCAFIWSSLVLFNHASGSDDKHTAQTVMTALVSGLVGYLLKK